MKIRNHLLWAVFSVGSLLVSQQALSQSYIGLPSGNYSGISGVSLQPASIADSRLKWDLNLFSIDVNYNNNFFYVKKDAILGNKFFKDPYKSDFNAVKRDLLKIGTDNNEPVYVRLNSTIQLPSVMITTGRRSAIALNIRQRTFMQIDNMSPELARLIYEGFDYAPYMNKNFTMKNLRTDILSYLEVGFTYARVLYNDGTNFLKFGITGNYLGGIASGYMNSDKLDFAFHSDSTLSARSDRINYGHSSDFDLDFANRKDFSPESSAFSYNVGLVYEYRGNIDAFNFWKYDQEGKQRQAQRRDKNKYLFKLGVSYMNGGTLDFTKPSNVNDFAVNVNKYDFGNVHAGTIKEVDSALASVVMPLNNDSSYSVALPRVFSAQVDLKIAGGLYLNLMGYFPLDNLGSKSSIHATKTFAVTPRWENRWFGIYIPVTFNEYHDTNLGAAIRLGPLFFGSGNLGSVLFKDNLKQADFNIGLKIPIGFGKPSKAMQAFRRLSRKDTLINRQRSQLAIGNQSIFELQQTNDSLRTALEKLQQELKDQQPTEQQPAYQAPHIPITININNYTGTPSRPGTRDSTVTKIIRVDSAIRAQQPTRELEKTDTISATTTVPTQKDTMYMQLNNNLQAAPAEETGVDSSNASIYELMQERNNRMRAEVAQLKEQLQQQKIDSQRTNLLQQQVDTLTKMIEEQNNKIQDYKDPAKKKTIIDRVGKVFKGGRQSREEEATDDTYERHMEQLQNRLEELEDARDQLAKRRKRLNRRERRRYRRHDENPDVTIETHPRYVMPKQQPSFNVTPVIPFGGRNAQTKTIRDTVLQKDTVYLERKHLMDNIRNDSIPETPFQPVPDTIRVIDTVVARARPEVQEFPPLYIYFSINSARLDPAYEQQLNYVAAQLHQHPNLKVRIAGFTDDSGPANFNKALSKKRAEAVKEYLLHQDILASRIETFSFGEQDAGQAQLPANRALKRVVVIRFASSK